MLGLGSSIVTQGFVEGAPAPLLLDTYTGATAAYSLRKLSNTYTGSAIKVSDGTNTQDIGFDANGDLDTSALATFCGSNDGFIDTWYDQVGSNDLVQTTSSLQPKIYDATNGVLEENSKPTVDFDSNYLPVSGSRTMTAGDFNLFLVGVQKSNDVTYGRFFDNDFTNGIWLGRALNGNGSGNGVTMGGAHSQSPYGADQSVTNDTQILIYGYRNKTSGKTSVSINTSTGDESIASNAGSNLAARGFALGAHYNDGNTAQRGKKKIQEVIIWENDSSVNGSHAAIETAINDYYSIY